MHGDPAIKFKGIAVANNWDNRMVQSAPKAGIKANKRPIVANNGARIKGIGTIDRNPTAMSKHAKHPNPKEAKQIQAQGARKAKTSHGAPLFGMFLAWR